jgi:hypothetical protein
MFRSQRCYEGFLELLSPLPERFRAQASRLRANAQSLSSAAQAYTGWKNAAWNLALLEARCNV